MVLNAVNYSIIERLTDLPHNSAKCISNNDGIGCHCCVCVCVCV